MKTKKLVLLSGLLLSLFMLSGYTTAINYEDSFSVLEAQNGLVVFATFDGHEDYGYNFVTKGKDDEEHTLTFQKVEETVLKAFNLNSDDLVGTKFKITFNKEIKVTKDADGYEDEEEINTITNLEKA
ncbi:hypothetical protein WJN01_04820 [Flavobacteriaceae bacterium SZ-1-7]|uniref:hypothetical protein n=1 Tax=Tamlana sedimenti TaxID=3134126 RepID=UPI003120B9C1